METNEIQDAIKAALNEQVAPLVKGQVDTAIKEALSAKNEAEEKAAVEANDKFKSFGDYLSSIVKIRRDAIPDNRLTFVTSKGEIAKPQTNVRGKATLVEGTDSAGGYCFA